MPDTRQIVDAVLSAVSRSRTWKFMERQMRQDRDQEDLLPDPDDLEDEDEPPFDPYEWADNDDDVVDPDDDLDDDEDDLPVDDDDEDGDYLSHRAAHDMIPRRRPTRPPSRRNPGRGVERYARKPLQGGHSRFPDSLYDGNLRLHTINGDSWKDMQVPGGVPESHTVSRTHDYQRETAAREMAERCYQREDSTSDANQAAGDYLSRPARL